MFFFNPVGKVGLLLYHYMKGIKEGKKRKKTIKILFITTSFEYSTGMNAEGLRLNHLHFHWLN